MSDGATTMYTSKMEINGKRHSRPNVDYLNLPSCQQLQDNDLYLKPEKCSFWQTKVEYLGLIIEEGKIGMDLTKLKGIPNWPKPTTVKQVRTFLGFGNYYRQFIHGYGDLMKPLNDLLRKEEKFDWTE